MNNDYHDRHQPLGCDGQHSDHANLQKNEDQKNFAPLKAVAEGTCQRINDQRPDGPNAQEQPGQARSANELGKARHDAIGNDPARQVGHHRICQ